MPRGYRTAPLGSLEVRGSPYSVRVLRVGYNTPRADGSALADGTVTLVWGGPVTALVDTGGPWDRALLPELLGEQGLSPRDVTHVVVTHGHTDHAGNLNLFPGAAELLVGFDLSRGPGLFVPHGLARGEPLALHGPHLEALPTPGHTRAHAALAVRGTALGTVLVAGDLFEREGDEAEWEALSEDPPLQRRSRRGALAMADVIVPGHGPPFRVLREPGGRWDGDGDGDGDGDNDRDRDNDSDRDRDGDNDSEVAAGGGAEGRGDEA